MNILKQLFNVQFLEGGGGGGGGGGVWGKGGGGGVGGGGEGDDLVKDSVTRGKCLDRIARQKPESRPFPSSLGPLYQNEVKCSSFLMEMIFHPRGNKTHFHKKGFALGLMSFLYPEVVC